MKSRKISISLDPDLCENISRAAHGQETTVSRWLAEAAAARLRHESLDEFFREYQEEHGAFTDEELEQARAKLNLPPKKKSA